MTLSLARLTKVIEKNNLTVESLQDYLCKALTIDEDNTYELPAGSLIHTAPGAMQMQYPSDAKNCHIDSDYVIKDFHRMFFDALDSDMSLALEKRTRKLIQKLLYNFRLLHDTLRKFMAMDDTCFELKPTELVYLEKIMPLILISHNEECIPIHGLKEGEYRSRRALRFGNEICSIATDSEDNRLRVMRYLDQHPTGRVSVLLFDDLRQAQKSRGEPTPKYHHRDGIPRLDWLAAKCIAEQGESFFAEARETLSAKDKPSAVELLDTAQRYTTISLTPE